MGVTCIHNHFDIYTGCNLKVESCVIWMQTDETTLVVPLTKPLQGKLCATWLALPLRTRTFTEQLGLLSHLIYHSVARELKFWVVRSPLKKTKTSKNARAAPEWHLFPNQKALAYPSAILHPICCSCLSCFYTRGCKQTDCLWLYCSPPSPSFSDFLWGWQ